LRLFYLCNRAIQGYYLELLCCRDKRNSLLKIN
jgi:hypothetical protein